MPSSAAVQPGAVGNWRIAKIVFGVVGVLALLMVVGVLLDPSRFGGGVPADQGNFADVTPSPAPPLALVTTTVEELDKAYDENELTARDRFEGRPIRLTGTVLRIGSNQGEPTLLLQSSHTTAAAFADPAPLKALKAREHVTVTCEALTQTEVALVLRNCVLNAREEPAALVERRDGPQ